MITGFDCYRERDSFSITAAKLGSGDKDSSDTIFAKIFQVAGKLTKQCFYKRRQNSGTKQIFDFTLNYSNWRNQ
jgi:hypothetical protein